MPSWQNKVVEAALALRGSKRTMSDEQVAHRHWRAQALRPLPYGPPKALDRAVDLSVETIAGWPVYTARPRGGSATSQVLYLHGGAYVAEVSPFHWRLVAQLAARAPAEVVLPVYPLAPLSTAERTVAAVADLVTRLVDRHGAGNVTVMGDSAGGGMALAVAEFLAERGRARPASLVLISPWLDVTMTDPRQAEIEPGDPFLARPGLAAAGAVYAGDLDPTDYRVSPLNGSLTGLPPITLFTGTRDILHTDALALVAKAEAAGVPITVHTGPGLFHVYPLLPTPEGKRARAELVRAVAATRSRPAA